MSGFFYPPRRIRLDLAYDGGPYQGWQSQPSGQGIQDYVEGALFKLLKKPIRIMGSGRTDAGVHARAQVAHFDAPQGRMGEEAFFQGLNSLLPPSIRVIKVAEVDKDFHARFSAKGRLYHYYLKDGAVALPWEYAYCHRVSPFPPVQDLQDLAKVFLGPWDFSSFCAAKDPNPSKIREVYTSCFFYEEPFWVYKVEANAFLWRQVRSMIGTLLDCAQKGKGPEELEKILKAKNRSLAAASAPARGLFLEKVEYEK